MSTPQEMVEKMAAKSNEELLDMLARPNEWTSESLDAAKAELGKRNVDAISPVQSKTSFAFQNISSLTRFLKFALVLGSALAGVAIVSGFLQVSLLGRAFTQEEAQMNDTRQEVVGGLQVIWFLVTAIVFGRWIFLANKNVRALGAEDLTFTPGWAVGYLFIPILCLWKPYQAMKELWRASQNPHSWKKTPAASILPLWWTCWIVHNLLERVCANQMKSAHTIIEIQSATYGEIISDFIGVALWIVAMILVSQIHRAQTKIQNKL